VRFGSSVDDCNTKKILQVGNFVNCRCSNRAECWTEKQYSAGKCWTQEKLLYLFNLRYEKFHISSVYIEMLQPFAIFQVLELSLTLNNPHNYILFAVATVSAIAFSGFACCLIIVCCGIVCLKRYNFIVLLMFQTKGIWTFALFLTLIHHRHVDLLL